MTQRNHLEVRKWGVKGPPILCSKNGLPWDFSENLWSKIWGALNPPFSHLQMIPLGHMNIPTGLFLDFNFISIHPIWLNSGRRREGHEQEGREAASPASRGKFKNFVRNSPG